MKTRPQWERRFLHTIDCYRSIFWHNILTQPPQPDSPTFAWAQISIRVISISGKTILLSSVLDQTELHKAIVCVDNIYISL